MIQLSSIFKSMWKILKLVIQTITFQALELVGDLGSIIIMELQRSSLTSYHLNVFWYNFCSSERNGRQLIPLHFPSKAMLT